MHKCPKCGTEFEGNFCPQCGEKFTAEKICPKCGETLSESARFCPKCGYSLDAAKQPQKAGKPVTAGTKKLYTAVSVLPAVLFGLFSVLLFLFFLAPVAVMPGGELMGQKIPSTSYGNIYESSNYAGMSFTSCMTALIVFAAFALFITVLILISCIFSNMRCKQFAIAGKKIFLRNILTAIGYVLFFVLFLVSCILLGQIASDDGGLGLLKAGAAPTLVLVFTLICSLAALVCAFAGAHLRKTYPALVAETEKKLAAKPTKVETWIKKHKAWTAAISAVLVVAIVVGVAVPVGSANRHNGTYFAYNGDTEEYNTEKFYKLSGGSWVDESGTKGKISFDGEKVTLTYDPTGGMDTTGSSSITIEGTIDGDVLKVGGAVFAKEGHKHNMKNRECICGVKDNSSEGLNFTKQDDHWIVSSGTCTDINIVISAWHEDGPVTEIRNYAFSARRGLTSITIPDSVTLIGNSAFKDCSGLASITIPDSVTSIGEETFYNCGGLKSVTIGSGVTEIGYRAFYGCYGLIGELKIPDGVTSIGREAFYNCCELTSVTIPDSVTSIGGSAFAYCSGLTSITIPDRVTEIEGDTFENCSGLKSVTIGSGVAEIRQEAFESCSGLKTVYYKGTPSEWDEIEIGAYNFSLKDVTRCYFSHKTPTAEQWEESENWWHYDEDGKTIILWTKEA